MFSITFKSLLVLTIVCVIRIDCEIYQDRPKIKTTDGNLILEPALDKSIFLRPNGPKSSIFVGNNNILNENKPKETIQYQAANEFFDKYLNGQNGILQRLEILQNKASTVSDTTLFNITTLSRRINSLNRKLIALQNQLNNNPRDACNSNPCQHEGTCLNLVDGYHCLCPNNWEGRDCEVDVNECQHFAGTDLGCQNGATCVNRAGTYECLCQSSWFGLHCTTKAKDCSAGDFEMCGYGTCVPVTTGEGIKCICHQGWTNNATSVTCLTDVNECERYQEPRCSVNPRVECVNVPGSFRCGQCPVGYEGDGYICNDIDECTTIRNGGCSPVVPCHNTIGSRICGSCPPGYIGDGITCLYRGACAINHGGCHSSAQCLELPSPTGVAVQCVCPEGMDGDGLGFAGCYVSTGNYTTGCDSNPCSHGRCHRMLFGYTCICYKGYGGAQCDTPINSCAVNPCQNDGVCRQDAISGFRCECTAQYSGTLCQVRLESCGGILDAEEGNIAFPLSNNTYHNNAQCAWVINTHLDKVINVTFSRFFVEHTPECSGDFLQIHDGRKSSSQLIGRFCGDTLPMRGNIISSHNNLYLWFHSDGTVAKTGFALHWTSIKPVCGDDIAALTHGHISSPGSPGPYPPNRDCYWHLETIINKIIIIHFYALDIEAQGGCSSDYLAIYDGDHTTDPLLGRYCNSTQPPPLQSSGSLLLLHFHSDAHGSGKGFQITYAPIEGCGGYFTMDKGEIVSSSIVKEINYDCEYKIKTSAETKIKIYINSYKLVKSYGCYHDYLTIYDGSSSDSPLVGVFCGSVYPATYTSSSNTLYIKFKIDSSSQLRISYEAICEFLSLGDSGIIKSPLYPFNYPANKVCVYVIRTEPGKAIQLTFQDFDIEGKSECLYDNVEVRDGHNINSTLLGRFCGSEHLPPVQTSTHNEMYIRFKSDKSLSGAGFYANYTTIDVECGGIYRNATGIINHPSESAARYDNQQSCQWLLIAPEGMHIKLTWNRFEIENDVGCWSDYLELVEINEYRENDVLGRYCGTHSPPALTTAANLLKLKFVSNHILTYAGFSLSYEFLDDKTHCSRNYNKPHGYINSPGWPARYDGNMDCTWIITVPDGQLISLNISNFYLQYAGMYSCFDFLEIRNGGSANSSLIGQFCGKFKSKRITSLSNVLYLYFHSDRYYSGTGFNIEWEGTITGCGGTLVSSTGSIASPNYPNAQCFYKIATSAGSRIRISFIELDLKEFVWTSNDYIEIYDGRDMNAHLLRKHYPMSTELANVETTTNFAFIKFRLGAFEGNGFMLNYITLCNNNLTGRHGIIESPDYPNTYPMNLKCLWNIQVPKGNRINITFTHFDISRRAPYMVKYNMWQNRHKDDTIGSICYNDYLEMKESYETNFTKKYCSLLPSMVSSKSNSFQIQFTSGDYSASSGFRLEWVSYGCGGHIQKQSGTVLLDRNLNNEKEIECEWLIETVPGKSINITFTKIYILDSKNCTTDAIEIYNGQNTKAPLLSRFCHETYASIQSDSNFMLIRFIKLSTLKDVHFNAYFNSSNSKCGGVINTLSGFFYSKNYPRNYDNNLDCIWYITIPTNHRIEINFVDIDLYSNPYPDYYSSSYNNDCGDTILIYDDGNYRPSSNYTYHICPNANSKRILTMYSPVVVQFKSDRKGTAKGFKANFNITCGGISLAAQDGIITYNKNINNSNRSCIWIIIAPTLVQKISLTLTHISLPKDLNVVTNMNCPSAFLRVFDGHHIEAPLIGEYCGRKLPPMIVSHGSAVTIELGSYTDNIAGTFSLHYSPLINACGGSLLAEEGTIASPLYPRPYPVNVDCEWVVSTSPGNTAYIVFEQFNLEYSEGCNEDYLELRKDDGGGELFGVYCGADIPTNYTKAAKIYIKFHSNSRTSGQGFLLHYGYLRDNVIRGQYGEIASPLYPQVYGGAGEYIWRLYSYSNIALTIDHLEIPSHGDVSYNKLTIYDGSDNNLQILEQLHGVISEKTVIQTSAKIVHIKLTMDDSNTGSMFYLTWRTVWSHERSRNIKDAVNCGANQTELVLLGQVANLTSPHYPKRYINNLNCEWIYRTEIGRHLSITFVEFDLEESRGCNDFISISSADSPGNWKLVKKACQSSTVNMEINTSVYMKINFKSDSIITRKGFFAQVRSKCGGIVTNSSGEIGPTWFDAYANSTRTKVQCDWIIKMRPGRKIKVYFINTNITNEHGDCLTSVVLRNGDSIEAPPVGNGKYCGSEYERTLEAIETSSNSLFISYKSENRDIEFIFKRFIIFYEEISHECGFTSLLAANHNWETINSPNYPSVPISYSECVWVFTGPPGEVLRIDFIDRFDLDYTDDCGTEVIEIRDGSSTLSPSLGRYCGKKPSTIKSSSNAIYIKYSTQLKEPRNGFKANISIDVCGGTIYADFGEVTAPGYPKMQKLPKGTVCTWHVIGPPRHIFLVKSQDIQLPLWESPNCVIEINIEETLPINNTINVLNTICDCSRCAKTIETSSNSFVIKLTFGQIQRWLSDIRGFRFSFNSSRPQCGDTITTSEGYLTTFNYPQETTLTYCWWHITVPNKSRKIRVELIDFDQEKQLIKIYNDNDYSTVIVTIPNDNFTSEDRIYESVGNQLAIYVGLHAAFINSGTAHRFKAKFTSDEQALCGGDLESLINQQLTSPDLLRPYTCRWHYNNQMAINNNNLIYSSIYITAKINSSVSRTLCRYYDPQILITSPVNDRGLTFRRQICGNTESSHRIPSSILDIIAIKHEIEQFDYHLEIKSQPCGGIVYVGENPINIINTPDSYNDTLDCAWVLMVPNDNRIEIQMEGSFLLESDDEFIIIMQDFNQRMPIMGKYYKGKLMDAPLVTNFPNMYVQYHSNIKNNTKIKLMAKTVTHQCGGLLTSHQNTFASPNYPKAYNANEECVWEIHADIGFTISLQFIDRFVVEDMPNCTKDVVIIYDWIDDVYKEKTRVCGRKAPPLMSSTNNRLKVVLRTDAETNLDGFRAKWTPDCRNSFLATDIEHILYSPGYPNSYQPDMNCMYIIYANNNHKISLKFHDFELEGWNSYCASDNLTVTLVEDFKEVNHVFCGREKPATMRSADKIIIRFQSDHYLQRKGFKLSYSTFKCGGKVNDTTIITSSFDDEDYDIVMNCTWVIEAPRSKIVVVKFFYIDVEFNPECSSDHMALYDGLDIDVDKRLALLCGNINSTTVLRSTGNGMVIEFITDWDYNYKGFKGIVYFSYSETIGCGGRIDLDGSSTHTLKSPLISNVVYENFLDCSWSITSPPNTVIKITFSKFHIASCQNVNQTIIGYDMCDCDLVEIKDGLSHNSLLIGTYCGQVVPPQLITSANVMSVRLSTDGELVSTGFEAILTVQPTVCGETVIPVSFTPQRLKSPGYDEGSVPRSLHCMYRLDTSAERYNTVRITVFSLQLSPPIIDSANVTRCLNDKLIISTTPSNSNITFSKNLIMNLKIDHLFTHKYLFSANTELPDRIDLCGNKKAVDIYVSGNIFINLITSPDSGSEVYRGVEIEVAFVGFCGRNYTEPQGRVVSSRGMLPRDVSKDCYVLITAPENYTIAVYFLRDIVLNKAYYYNLEDKVYLEIFDGNQTSARQITKMYNSYEHPYPVFSTGRYMLLHSSYNNKLYQIYDMNYVTTDKGSGCGGKINNIVGAVSSPFYPNTYRHVSICEWILETPVNTQLMIRFTDFDLGTICDQNYLQLVDSKGVVVRTFCSESPADYTSDDNYLKLVFHTTMNNWGKGWYALFTGTKI